MQTLVSAVQKANEFLGQPPQPPKKWRFPKIGLALSYHPFIRVIFHEITHPDLGGPPRLRHEAFHIERQGPGSEMVAEDGDPKYWTIFTGVLSDF